MFTTHTHTYNTNANGTRTLDMTISNLQQTQMVCFLAFIVVNEWIMEHKKKEAWKREQDKERPCVPGSILEIKGKYKSN